MEFAVFVFARYLKISIFYDNFVLSKSLLLNNFEIELYYKKVSALLHYLSFMTVTFLRFTINCMIVSDRDTYQRFCMSIDINLLNFHPGVLITLTDIVSVQTQLSLSKHKAFEHHFNKQYLRF